MVVHPSAVASSYYSYWEPVMALKRCSAPVEKRTHLITKSSHLFLSLTGPDKGLSSLILNFTDVGRFMVITCSIHILWRFWEYKLDYFPLKTLIHSLSASLVRNVCLQTFHILRLWIGDGIFLNGVTIRLNNRGSLEVFEGCSGLKQYAQFGILILMCRGSLLRKLIYIPLGITIVHLVNIIRMAGLSLIILYGPGLWHAGHDVVFKVLFYVVIFSLWVFWNDNSTGYHSTARYV
jgi:exosortase/archaeosortase family protein